MNGFEVFRFTRNVVPQLVNSYLEESNQSLAAYDLVALHQASKLVVSTICASLKYRNTLCDDFACGQIGNLGAGSIGAWLSQISSLDKKGPLKMLAVGFGSGLSWGLGSIVVNVQRNEVIYV
jgi:3-oxoacyl-[acyl-carrier-protein] synthase III